MATVLGVLPETMFMSLYGLLKEDLSGVGLKVWTMRREEEREGGRKGGNSYILYDYACCEAK